MIGLARPISHSGIHLTLRGVEIETSPTGEIDFPKVTGLLDFFCMQG
jgi:hypothetical protein